MNLRQIESGALERLNRELRRGGILHMTMIRLLPLAPFGVVNVMGGAARVRVVPFVVGSFPGSLPGNLLITAFGRPLHHRLTIPARRS